MSKVADIKELPFTNEKGHVINPGDPVLYVTVSTGSVSVNTGKYRGYRETKSYYGSGTNKSVVIAANKVRTIPIDVNGNDCGYGSEWRANGYKTRKEPYVGITTLQNNRVYPLNTSVLDMKF